uniref:SMODS domain-containing nucleotidyltransferase n=1 Tax=Rhodococcus erythropolis TaxID=1833 RepID=UPI000BB388EB|nr:nucleotidyltransferase [Rhodococcus erythropolis]
MSTSSRFEKFVSNISLTQIERDEATARSNAVAKKLHDHYYPTRAYTGDTKLLIGSHGKRTRVRPVRDVDMIFRIPPATFTRFNDYASNGQSALLQEIRSVLRTRFPSTNVKGDGPIVLVDFANGHTVEVLPAWHYTNAAEEIDRYWIPHTRDGGSWKLSSYAAEFRNVDDSDRASAGQTRRLIKMMKVWQQYCNVPVKSLCLELRAVRFLATWSNRGKSSNWDDYMIRDFFEELIDRANYYCEIPGITEKCYYGDAWLSKARTALANAQRACSFEAAGDEYNAAVEWRKIFGAQYGF